MSEHAHDVLVEPEWLESRLDDDSIRIVEVDENPALYAESHVPGAIGLGWDRDLQDPQTRSYLGREQFGELLGRRGISNDHLIVLYGDRNNGFAAFAYWCLKYYGHDRVRLMNGSRERWMAEGRPMTSEVPSYPPAKFTAGPGDASIRAVRDDVLAAIGGSSTIVDVRSPQEFAGELVAAPGYENEGVRRAGRIPGARSVPWAAAVQTNGAFKPVQELRELYARSGVIDGDPVISYCRTGERAAQTWFVLHELLGVQQARTYAGSWAEWGNLDDVPIETGKR